jgi:hypothetical protein
MKTLKLGQWVSNYCPLFKDQNYMRVSRYDNTNYISDKKEAVKTIMTQYIKEGNEWETKLGWKTITIKQSGKSNYFWWLVKTKDELELIQIHIIKNNVYYSMTTLDWETS